MNTVKNELEERKNGSSPDLGALRCEEIPDGLLFFCGNSTVIRSSADVIPILVNYV
jgi:hypothetical protein